MFDDCHEFARKYPNFVLGLIGAMLMLPLGFVVNLAIAGLMIHTSEIEEFIGWMFVVFCLGTMLMIIAFLRALHRRGRFVRLRTRLKLRNPGKRP